MDLSKPSQTSPYSSPLFSKFLKLRKRVPQEERIEKNRSHASLLDATFDLALEQLYTTTLPYSDLPLQHYILPQLIPPLETYLEYFRYDFKPHFLTTNLIPKLWEVPLMKLPAGRNAGGELEFLFMKIVIDLAAWWNTIREREKKGLLRTAQVRILTLAIEAVTGELRNVVSSLGGRLESEYRLEPESRSEAESANERLVVEVYWELKWVLQRNRSLVCEFLAGSEFRSERMERILLGYLEDGRNVNWEVVRGVEEKDRLVFGREGAWKVRSEKYRPEPPSCWCGEPFYEMLKSLRALDGKYFKASTSSGEDGEDGDGGAVAPHICNPTWRKFKFRS